MREEVERNHPGVHTSPNFSEIQSFVTQCFKKEKDGNDAAPGAGRGSRGANDDLPSDLKEAVVSTVDLFGGQLKPFWVLCHLELQFSTKHVDQHKEDPSKLARKKIGEWRNRKK